MMHTYIHIGMSSYAEIVFCKVKESYVVSYLLPSEVPRPKWSAATCSARLCELPGMTNVLPQRYPRVTQNGARDTLKTEIPTTRNQ